MVEYRLTVTVAMQAGRIEAAAERVVDVFEQVHPEVGAVAGGDFELETLEVTFALGAADVNAAVDLGRTVYAERRGGRRP